MNSVKTDIDVFIAYAREDQHYLNKLRIYLNPLSRNKTINIWYDGEIIPGTVWEKQIKTNLHNADIVLLLVSAYSLASDYFYEKEMAEALERHHREETLVVPVILSDCMWDKTPLHDLQALPRDANPLINWDKESSAYSSIVRGLDSSIKAIIKNRRNKLDKIKAQEDFQRKEEEACKQKAEVKEENRKKDEALALKKAQEELLSKEKEEKPSTTQISKDKKNLVKKKQSKKIVHQQMHSFNNDIRKKLNVFLSFSSKNINLIYFFILVFLVLATYKIVTPKNPKPVINEDDNIVVIDSLSSENKSEELDLKDDSKVKVEELSKNTTEVKTKNTNKEESNSKKQTYDPPPPAPKDIEVVKDEEMELDIDVPFALIENVPVFPGCENEKTNVNMKKCTSLKISDFVEKKFNTELANELGLTGRQRINVIFSIDQTGSITGVRARGPHPGLEREAVRVISSLPKMKPGVHRGKVVKVPYTLPIVFTIAD